MLDISAVIRAMRNATAKSNKVLVASSGSTMLVGNASNRIGVIISASSIALTRIGTNNDLDVVTGILLPTNGNPLKLSLFTDGAIVLGPIFAIAPAGDMYVNTIEIFAPS